MKRGRCEEIVGSPNFKSSWERNVYRVLHRLYDKIEYEPKRFEFKTPYRKHTGYTPDFICEHAGASYPPVIYEVKGWLDTRSQSKLLGFKRDFPDVAKTTYIVTIKKNRDWVLKHGFNYVDYDGLRASWVGKVKWEG